MNPTLWIAHVLAFHLSVPEPVDFKIDTTYPFKYEAMTSYVGFPRFPTRWNIVYDAAIWEEKDDKRHEFVIAHELCHAVYEYDTNWDNISKKEQKHRHDIVNACAKKIIRDHKNECRNDAKNSK